MKYLSESCPEIREPKRYPTKSVEVANGTFHWLSQTRFHCKERQKMELTHTDTENMN